MALPANPWQAMWRKMPVPLQNRYFLTLLIFFFILIFLDSRHSLWTQWRLYRTQKRLESDRAFYQEKIQQAREEAEDFDMTKEKYAREHYFMKQPDEDVYIIEEKK